MISIQIEKSENNVIEIEVSGHSTSAEFGRNIVCASISVLTISIINGLTEVCKLKNLEVIEKAGYIKLRVPSNTSISDKNLINLFLDTLILSFKQIKKEYPDEIELNIKEI